MRLQPAAPLSKIYRKIIATPAKAPGHSRPTAKDTLQKAYTLIYAQNHPAAIQLLKPLKGVAPLLLLGDLYTLDKEYERALQCYVQAAQI
jgi:hypothetical protein